MGPLCKIYLTSPLHQWQENCYGLQRSECNIKNSSRLTHLCEGLPHIRLWTAFIFPLATVILSIPSKGNFVFEIYFCSGVRYRLFMKRFRCALYVGRVRISLNYFIVTWQCVWCYSSHSYVLRAEHSTVTDWRHYTCDVAPSTYWMPGRNLIRLVNAGCLVNSKRF